MVRTQEGSEDLNAGRARFAAGEGVGTHLNREGNVVSLGLTGSGTVVVDGERFARGPVQMIFVPKECVRATRGDFAEFAYLTVHRRGPMSSPGRPGEDIGEREITGRSLTA